MATYVCSDCSMEVTNIRCGKCGSELEYSTLAKEDGSTVGISKCPQGCGKIKSPVCCSHDMVAND